MTKPGRGEVWQTQFWPSTGAEITKTRPAVVLNDEGYGILELSIVVPVTDWKPVFEHYPWFVQLTPTTANGLSKVSGADTFQVKSLANQRLLSKIGNLTEAEVDQIATTVAACIGVEL
jgi:mRNA interferase MazF